MVNFTIRNAVTEDIPMLLDMIKSVQRMVAFEFELKSWMNVDKEAIFVAVTEPGEVIGCCSGLALSDDRGFIGLYIVKEEYRGQGIGSQLLSAATRRLGDRNIGICGREDAIREVYGIKRGFTFISDHHRVYYVCTEPKHTQTERDFKWNIICCDFNNNKQLVSEIVRYDFNLHRYNSRKTIVYNTLSEPGCLCIAAQMEYRSVVGYICVRPVATGQLLIAPFYADSPDVARSLLQSAVARADLITYPEGLVARFPITNRHCENLFKEFGFQSTGLVIHTAYTKSLIDIPVSKIYTFHSTVFCTE